MTGPSELSRERFRLARLALAAGSIERILGAVLGAARVALLAWGLTTRDYGLYVAVLGVVATAGLVDFGLTFGLLNAVSEARGRDDDGAVRALVSTAFAIYGLITLATLTVFLPFAFLAPMGALLHLDPDQVGLARTIAAIGFGEALLVMPLRVFPSTFAGMQLQHVGSAYRTIAGIVQFIGLCVALVVWRGSLLHVVAVTAATDLLGALGFAAWAWRRRVVVDLRAARRRHARKLFGSGLLFTVTNVANLLRRTFPAIIIANALGPRAVPAFSVPFAMFTIGLSVSDMVTGSLWPAYGEAGARGDWPWIARAFRISSTAALLIAGGVALLGAFAGAELVTIWAPKIALPPHLVFGILAIWLLTQASSVTAGTLASGLNRLWLYMWTNIGEGLTTFCLGLWLVRASGVEGVAIAMVVGGVAGALAVNLYVLPLVTGGNVRVDVGGYARLLVCIAPAVLVGVATRHAVHGWPAFARMVTIAAALTVVYGLAAWTIGLPAAGRARIVERLRRVRPS